MSQMHEIENYYFAKPQFAKRELTSKADIPAFWLLC
jgi:hypothetical protein